jgi:hypothetical protein
MQKIGIDISTYNRYYNDSNLLSLVQRILFNDKNRLSYNKTKILFEIDPDQIELIFPMEYKLQLAHLQQLEKEGK